MKNPWEGFPKSAPFDREYFLILNVAVGRMLHNGSAHNSNVGHKYEHGACYRFFSAGL
jgi:hypothetical protein